MAMPPSTTTSAVVLTMMLAAWRTDAGSRMNRAVRRSIIPVSGTARRYSASRMGKPVSPASLVGVRRGTPERGKRENGNGPILRSG